MPQTVTLSSKDLILDSPARVTGLDSHDSESTACFIAACEAGQDDSLSGYAVQVINTLLAFLPNHEVQEHLVWLPRPCAPRNFLLMGSQSPRES